jgi:hypothetical protein
MHQLHDFNGFCNNKGITQNLSAKINTAIASLYMPASSFIIRFLRLAQKNRANGKWQNCVFLAVRMEVKITRIKILMYHEPDMEFSYM